jgi:hypothetical protein
MYRCYKGDIIAFNGTGFIAKLLSGLLGLFDPWWRKLSPKPWHLAIAWEKAYDGWYIFEATASGQKINYYSDKHLSETSRSYSWFDKTPTKKQMAKFLKEHVDKKYDVAIYLWTMIQYIIRHYFNRRIPRLLDDRYTCWELVDEWCNDMGKPIQSKYDCVMISDIMKNLESDNEIRD